MAVTLKASIGTPIADLQRTTQIQGDVRGRFDKPLRSIEGQTTRSGGDVGVQLDIPRSIKGEVAR